MCENRHAFVLRTPYSLKGKQSSAYFGIKYKNCHSSAALQDLSTLEHAEAGAQTLTQYHLHVRAVILIKNRRLA